MAKEYGHKPMHKRGEGHRVGEHSYRPGESAGCVEGPRGNRILERKERSVGQHEGHRLEETPGKRE